MKYSHLIVIDEHGLCNVQQLQALRDIPGVREVLVNKQMSTASVRYVQESDQNMKSVSSFVNAHTGIAH